MQVFSWPNCELSGAGKVGTATSLLDQGLQAGFLHSKVGNEPHLLTHGHSTGAIKIRHIFIQGNRKIFCRRTKGKVFKEKNQQECLGIEDVEGGSHSEEPGLCVGGTTVRMPPLLETSLGAYILWIPVLLESIICQLILNAQVALFLSVCLFLSWAVIWGVCIFTRPGLRGRLTAVFRLP